MITHYRYVHVTERYTETLHVKKIFFLFLIFLHFFFCFFVIAVHVIIYIYVYSVQMGKKESRKNMETK